MRHPSDGRLRAYLDGELGDAEREAIERDMASGALTAHAARLAGGAETVRSRLDAVAAHAKPDVERALTRSHELRQGLRTPRDEGRVNMGTRIAKRPALVVGLVLVLLAGLLSFDSGRALARQMLSVFRVRRFAVIHLNTDPERFQEVVGQLEEDLFVTGEPIAIREPTRTVVDTIEQASEAAGFEVLMPAYWPDDASPRITVEGPSEQALRFRGDGLRLLLELAEMDPAAIPAELVEGEVRLTTSGAVCLKGSDTTITQVADAMAVYPDDVDVATIVEAGLRVLGLDAAQAHRLSREYDWTTTALVPVLSDAIEVRETDIAGAQALVVRTRESEGPHANRATLLMERDGILYIVAGQASFERLAQIAQSMF